MGLIVSSTLIFALGVMNLIIAVLQKEYEDAERRAPLLFQCERARLCVRYMLQPAWPSGWPEDARLAWGLVALLASLWLGLLCVAAWPAACCLAGAELALAALALRTDWDLTGRPRAACDGGGRPPFFLWICHRSDFDEERYQDASARESEVDVLGRRLDELAKNQESVSLQLRTMHLTLSAFLRSQLHAPLPSMPAGPPRLGPLVRGRSDSTHLLRAPGGHFAVEPLPVLTGQPRGGHPAAAARARPGFADVRPSLGP